MQYEQKLNEHINEYEKTNSNGRHNLKKIGKYLFKLNGQHGGINIPTFGSETIAITPKNPYSSINFEQKIPVTEYNISGINFKKTIKMHVHTFYNNFHILIRMCIDDMLNGTFLLNSASSINIVKNLLTDYSKFKHQNNMINVNFSDQNVMFIGDLHGSAQTFIKVLYHMFDSSAKLRYKCVFLGDYTDRGQYGLHIILCLLYFEMNNENDIILIRGNHEDILTNIHLTEYFNGNIDTTNDIISHYHVNNNFDILKNTSFYKKHIAMVRSLCNKHFKDDKNCSKFNCQNDCNTILSNVMVYVTSQKNFYKEMHDYADILLCLQNAYVAMPIAAVVNINNVLYYCAHGGIDPAIFNLEHINNIDLLIKYVNSIPPVMSCNKTARQKFNYSSDVHNAYCNTLWHDMLTNRAIDVMPNNELLNSNERKIYNVNNFVEKRKESGAENLTIHNENGRHRVNNEQVEYFCKLFGISMIIRGHQVCNAGYYFNSRKALTLHTKVASSEQNNGAFAIVDNHEMGIFLLGNDDLKNKTFQTYVKSINFLANNPSDIITKPLMGISNDDTTSEQINEHANENHNSRPINPHKNNKFPTYTHRTPRFLAPSEYLKRHNKTLRHLK